MIKDFDIERELTEEEQAYCSAVGALAERSLGEAITLTMWEDPENLSVTHSAYRTATACAAFRMIMPLRRARAHALVGKDHDQDPNTLTLTVSLNLNLNLSLSLTLTMTCGLVPSFVCVLKIYFVSRYRLPFLLSSDIL